MPRTMVPIEPMPKAAFPTRTTDSIRIRASAVSVRRTATMRIQKRITAVTKADALKTWSASTQSSRLTSAILRRSALLQECEPVAGAANRVVADRVQAGWTALRAGRWSAARELFEEAFAAEESPEALEGLSWAAWWLDDAEAVFDARERAYVLYRNRGDAAAAARMATWLAADQLDFRGAAAVAAGWLRRAHRLLEPLEPGPDHGWLAFHDGYVAHRGGDTDRARELASSAADLGRRFGVADLEVLGLALEGAALVACAEVGEGMRLLDEAGAAALEGGTEIPISGAWACCFLVSAC